MILDSKASLPVEDVTTLVTRRPTIQKDAIAVARETLADLDLRGAPALVERIDRFEERAASGAILLDRSDFARALDRIEPAGLSAIEGAAERIREFAVAQLNCLSPLRREMTGTGLSAGHDLVPIEKAGCYVPGGRFPLPSSVLMTAIPATVAGVRRIRLAGPRPTDATLAAAWFTGAESMLAAGGAHAIGALVIGMEGSDCDIIVGPGNRYVTAAKALVSGPDAPGGRPVAIDGLAGPSELLVIADETADPSVIAADLLAQAEHDPDAGVWFATTDPRLREMVREKIAGACEALPEPNRSIARTSIIRGGAIVVESDDELVEVAERLAPEHLEILTRNPGILANRIRHAGAVFLGEAAAEVFGDYGSGPNHVLPTGGSSRIGGGLSVLDFVRVRTWISAGGSEPSSSVVRETALLARVEGLEAHARAAEARTADIVEA